MHMQADDLALDAMALNVDEWIDLATATQIGKLAKAKLVFFYTCLGARLGAYAVQHGTPAAISTTIAMPINVAWRLRLAFYERCAQIEEQERSTKLGVQNQRLKAGWDEAYLIKVLGHMAD